MAGECPCPRWNAGSVGCFSLWIFLASHFSAPGDELVRIRGRGVAHRRKGARRPAAPGGSRAQRGSGTGCGASISRASLWGPSWGRGGRAVGRARLGSAPPRWTCGRGNPPGSLTVQGEQERGPHGRRSRLLAHQVRAGLRAALSSLEERKTLRAEEQGTKYEPVWVAKAALLTQTEASDPRRDTSRWGSGACY